MQPRFSGYVRALRRPVALFRGGAKSMNGKAAVVGVARFLDEAHGAHIVEQTSSGEWLEIIGHADSNFQSPALIDAAGIADVWYCPTSSAYPFPCSQSRFCSSADLRLRLKRK